MEEQKLRKDLLHLAKEILITKASMEYSVTKNLKTVSSEEIMQEAEKLYNYVHKN